MERFAKVFESNGRQIRVRKGENSDGDAALCISTMFAGHEMTIAIGYDDDEKGALDDDLDRFDQTQADAFVKDFEGDDGPIAILRALTE